MGCRGHTVKHAVYPHVMSGLVFIEIPKQFAGYDDQIIQNIQVTYILFFVSLYIFYKKKCINYFHVIIYQQFKAD